MRKILFPTLLFLLINTCVPGQNLKRLHNKAILADTHNDFPSASIEKNVAFDTDLKGITHSDLDRMGKGGVDVQVFSIFCGPEQAEPYKWANREIDSVYAWASRNPDKMELVKSYTGLRRAVREKKLAAMLGVEGGHMIEDKIENLDALFVRGVRYMTLTWNNSTSWASSAADETSNEGAPGHMGLTDFGKKIVERMNELGMIIDISHVGEQTVKDVLNLTTKPVIASHSCVWNLCPHRRNLKDYQIKAIAANGGVVQLNFYAGFIDSNYAKQAAFFQQRHQHEIDSMAQNGIQKDYASILTFEKYKNEVKLFQPPLSMLLDHLDYIVNLVGVNHVGLGSDFDGMEAGPIELNGVEDYPLITKALMERGYKKKEIKKILGGNFLRVFRENQK